MKPKMICADCGIRITEATGHVVRKYEGNHWVDPRDIVCQRCGGIRRWCLPVMETYVKNGLLLWREVTE